MYKCDCSNHRDGNYYVSEYLNVKMKSAQNLKNTHKTHYIHIGYYLHKSFLKLSN